MSETIDITSVDFEEKILGESRPALVDFYGRTCGPCRLLVPTLKALAKANADKAIVAKVEVESNMDLAAKYDVSVMPTLILFKNGEPVAKLVGVQKQSKIQELIDANL